MAEGPLVPGSESPEIDSVWLVKAITRLETKVDHLVALEARITVLERYKSWLSGAVAMVGAFGAFLGWYVAQVFSKTGGTP